MLVLTRKINEEIIIDGDIRVTVLSVQGDKVRLGIAAPPSVRIDRQEVHLRRSAPGEEAAREELHCAGAR
jgi:carbon storage regulator